MAASPATQRDGQRVQVLWILWLVLAVLLAAVGVVVFGGDAAVSGIGGGSATQQGKAEGLARAASLAATASDDAPAAQRVAIDAPAANDTPAPRTFTVHIRGVAAELFPYLQVQYWACEEARRQVFVAQPDDAGVLVVPAQQPAMCLAVSTPCGVCSLHTVAGRYEVEVTAGSEVELEPQQRLVGLCLLDQGRGLQPFRLGVDKPAARGQPAPVNVLAAEPKPETFYVALGDGPQLCVGGDAVLETGDLWQLDLGRATWMAQVRVQPEDNFEFLPQQLRISATVRGEPGRSYGERDDGGWTLSLMPGDYDLRWAMNGPSTPILARLHLQAGEQRELRLPLPPMHAYRGRVANWEQIEPHSRARMLRVDKSRISLQGDGSFELLVESEISEVTEIELSEVTTDSASRGARPARVLVCDNAARKLMLEDTFPALRKLRVSCAALRGRGSCILLYRASGQVWNFIRTGEEILLPEGDHHLLAVAIEKGGDTARIVAMQVVRCEAGEVMLPSNACEVQVLSAGDAGDGGWMIYGVPAEPFRVVVSLGEASTGTVLVPSGFVALRACRADIARDFPADAKVIDLR